MDEQAVRQAMAAARLGKDWHSRKAEVVEAMADAERSRLALALPLPEDREPWHPGGLQ